MSVEVYVDGAGPSHARSFHYFCVSDSVSHDASGEEKVADRDREQEASAGGRQTSTAAPEGETEVDGSKPC